MTHLPNKRIYLICMIILLSAACCFSGCNTNPPPIDRVEKLYLKFESDFLSVSNYLTSIPADSAYITDVSGEIRIDLTDQQISDPLIVDSLRHLWRAGCSSISMDRSDNSIKFVIWKTKQIGDAEAGILYAIDTDDSKDVTTQYLTELQPITGAWYYYVADYEEWRTHRQNE